MEENVAIAWTNSYKMNTTSMTCGKGVVSLLTECSIAEENEDILGWEAKGRLPPCAGADSGTDQFFSKDLHPSDDLNQLLYEMNLSTRSEKPFSLQTAVSAFDIATLSSAAFLCTFSLAITLR